MIPLWMKIRINEKDRKGLSFQVEKQDKKVFISIQ